jgi:hypothetical protein
VKGSEITFTDAAGNRWGRRVLPFNILTEAAKLNAGGSRVLRIAHRDESGDAFVVWGHPMGLSAA